MLTESKQMTESLRKLYKASSDFIGDASLSAEQQVALKTRSLWLPLLADNPWELPDDEPTKFTAHNTLIQSMQFLQRIAVQTRSQQMILTKESNTTIQSYNTAELWLISEEF